MQEATNSAVLKKLHLEQLSLGCLSFPVHTAEQKGQCNGMEHSLLATDSFEKAQLGRRDGAGVKALALHAVDPGPIPGIP